MKTIGTWKVRRLKPIGTANFNWVDLRIKLDWLRRAYWIQHNIDLDGELHMCRIKYINYYNTFSYPNASFRGRNVLTSAHFVFKMAASLSSPSQGFCSECKRVTEYECLNCSQFGINWSIGWRILKWSFEYTSPFIIWNNKVKNVKNIAILFKLLLYICWSQKEPFFNLFFVFKFVFCSPDIAAQFHLKLRWICRRPLALATWTRPWSSPKMTSRSSPWRDMLSFACVVASDGRRYTGSMVN